MVDKNCSFRVSLFVNNSDKVYNYRESFSYDDSSSKSLTSDDLLLEAYRSVWASIKHCISNNDFFVFRDDRYGMVGLNTGIILSIHVLGIVKGDS